MGVSCSQTWYWWVAPWVGPRSLHLPLLFLTLVIISPSRYTSTHLPSAAASHSIITLLFLPFNWTEQSKAPTVTGSMEAVGDAVVGATEGKGVGWGVGDKVGAKVGFSVSL